jgi:hypothetical protein
MRLLLASFLTLVACGPASGPGRFDVGRVTLPPCALDPQLPATIGQGAEVRVPLRPSRSDVALRVITLPAGTEATIDGDVLVYRSGFETLGRAAVVEVELTCGAKTSVVPLTLPVESTVRWGQAIEWTSTSGPEAREHPTLFIDDASPDTLWLFGGFGFVPRQFTVVNDLWRLELTTGRWERIDAMNAPMVAGMRVSAGTRASEFFLSGGETPAMTPSSEVFRLDVSQRPPRFEVVSVTGVVPNASLGSLVHDAPRRRLISFGGYTGSDVTADVHTLALDVAGAAWTRVDAGTGPSPRYGFFWAVDAGRLIVFSGGQTPTGSSPVNPAGDAWALDLATMRWTRLAPATPDAPARRNGCGALDPATRQLFVWSGTPDGATATPQLSVLSLAGTSGWSRITTTTAPTARGSCSAIFDAPRRRVLFGFGNTSAARFPDLQVLEVGPAK